MYIFKKRVEPNWQKKLKKDEGSLMLIENTKHVLEKNRLNWRKAMKKKNCKEENKSTIKKYPSTS